MQRNIHIVQTNWALHEPQLRLIREAVFIVEQAIPEDYEWDDDDLTAVQLVAYLDEKPVGCARVLDFKRIGRMAVLADYRNLGVGFALLNSAVDICREHGAPEIRLSAQLPAISLYEKAGFVVCSDAYLNTEILHKDMVLTF